MTVIQTICSVLSIFIACLTLVVTWIIPKKIAWNQMYSNLISEYRSYDFAIAVQGIIEFFAIDCKSDTSKIKEKYKEEIDIKIGFEIEYYPNEFNKMLKYAIDLGAEYLILGQHFLGNEQFCNKHTMYVTENVEDLKEYVSLVISAIKSGVISYVAHPDILNFTGDKNQYKIEMEKICIASLEYNVPLEINFLGIL